MGMYHDGDVPAWGGFGAWPHADQVNLGNELPSRPLESWHPVNCSIEALRLQLQRDGWWLGQASIAALDTLRYEIMRKGEMTDSRSRALHFMRARRAEGRFAM